MSAENKKTKDIDYLKEKINTIKIAMLTSEDQDGHLKSRPMTTLSMDAKGSLWFFISNQSFSSDAPQQAVNLSYVDPISQCYISISGLAEKVEDKDLKQNFWKPTFETWFPGGLSNPDLRLIRVQLSQAEYWDSDTNVMNLLFKVTDSILSGKTYVKGEQGEFSPGVEPN